MARPSPAAPALRRTAVAALVAAGALALPAAASAAPVPAPSAPAFKVSAASTPKACTPKTSDFATVDTSTPAVVADATPGDYTIRAKGSVGGYTTRGIESVTVFLDGDYVGRATLSKAQKFSLVVPALPRTWSIDVPAAAGTHDLLVCSNSGYGSLAGESTVVQVPSVTAGLPPL